MPEEGYKLPRIPHYRTKLETSIEQVVKPEWKSRYGIHWTDGKIFAKFNTPKKFFKDFSIRLVDDIIHGNINHYAIGNIGTPTIFEDYSLFIRQRWRGAVAKLGDLSKIDMVNSALIGRGASRILILEFSKKRSRETIVNHLVIGLHPEVTPHLKQIEVAIREKYPKSRVIVSAAKKIPPVKNPDI